MKRVLFLTLLGLVILLIPGIPAQAATSAPKDKGLLITPLRQYINLNAGSQKATSFTIANLTSAPLTINLSAKQFSVTDYTYDYRFAEPQTDWLKLSSGQITLQPNQSHDITYTIAIPAHTAPGGQYYTLFASANVSSGGLKSTVQAATLVYLTVNGSLTRTSQLHQAHVQHLSFGKQINYSLEPINTGNIYYFIYVNGQLHGLSAKGATNPVTHILYPNKVRRLNGAIPAPILPGIYHATFGYKADGGQSITRSSYVIFIPPWFIALLLATTLLLAKYFSKRKRTSKTS